MNLSYRSASLKYLSCLYFHFNTLFLLPQPPVLSSYPLHISCVLVFPGFCIQPCYTLLALTLRTLSEFPFQIFPELQHLQVHVKSPLTSPKQKLPPFFLSHTSQIPSLLPFLSASLIPTMLIGHYDHKFYFINTSQSITFSQPLPAPYLRSSALLVKMIAKTPNCSLPFSSPASPPSCLSPSIRESDHTT